MPTHALHPLHPRASYALYDHGYATKAALRRLMHEGGATRVAAPVYEQSRVALHLFLEGLVGDALVFMEHDRKRTLLPSHVAEAAAHRGIALAGEVGSEVVFPRTPFRRRVRQYALDYIRGARVSGKAADMIQHLCEAHIVYIYHKALLCADHDGRKTVMPADVELVVRVMGD